MIGVPQVTLLSIRAVQKRMYIGIRESEAYKLIISALTSAGLTQVDALVLFGGEMLCVPLRM